LRPENEGPTIVDGPPHASEVEMTATCLICHQRVLGEGAERAKSALVEHVLTRHPERIRHRGPLLIEALGCFGLQPSDLDENSVESLIEKAKRRSGSAAAPARPPDAGARPQANGRPTGPVLVVEDNADVREAMMALIASAGFRVRGAENGQQALEMLRDGSERPSLIVLDLMMPVMNGLEFRQHQLADPELSVIPVVVVTAYGRAADRERFRGAEVLGKPIELERMLDVVRARCLHA
jgi:CheY-like chemotaxis protein